MEYIYILREALTYIIVIFWIYNLAISLCSLIKFKDKQLITNIVCFLSSGLAVSFHFYSVWLLLFTLLQVSCWLSLFLWFGCCFSLFSWVSFPFFILLLAHLLWRFPNVLNTRWEAYMALWALWCRLDFPIGWVWYPMGDRMPSVELAVHIVVPNRWFRLGFPISKGGCGFR